MAKRFTDTDKWKKPFYRFLSPKLKCLWEYITCDCDIAGLWHVDMEIAEIKIGEPISMEEALDAFKNHIVVLDKGDKWFIPSFIEFQYGGQLTRNNNVFKSVDKVLEKYDLYKYLTVEIVDFSATSTAYRDRISKKVSDSIYLKFDLTCQYCQEQFAAKDLTIDHFVPLVRGGDNSDDNLVCCCKRCNGHKTDILPDIFLAKPHKFLKPTEYILSLLEAYIKLKGAFNSPEGGKDKDKAKEKEKVLDMDKDKEKAKGNSPDEKFVIPEMCRRWYSIFPLYTRDKGSDYEAMGKIAGFMMRQAGEKDVGNLDTQDKILNTLTQISEQVIADQFWANKPLKSIANHIQEFYNKIKNPVNGKDHTGATNGTLRTEVQAEFERRRAKRQQAGN